MKKEIILTIFVLCILYNLSAQKEDINSKWNFHSLDQVGLLQGDSKGAFHLQSVNGFEKKNWFAGIGAGLDYYRYKSVPLFAEAIKYFGKTKKQFFIYGDAGIHFVWEKTDNTVYYTEKYYPGFYGGGGIGYKAGLKNGTGFLLSAGYSYKRVNDQQTQKGGCPFGVPCYLQTNTNVYTDTYKYNLNRVIIQVGWMF